MKIKRLISFLVLVGMLVSMFSVTFSAEPETVETTAVVLTEADTTIEVISEDDKTARIIGYSGTATDIEIPSEINGYTITEIGNSAFERNSNLKSVIMNEGLSIIGFKAFSRCFNMTFVSLPESLTFIDTEAFSFCESLQSINLPANVRLGDTIFWGCFALAEITVSEDNIWYYVKDNALYSTDGRLLTYAVGRSDAELVIPDGITSIDNYAFAYSKLQTITIPATVTSLSSNSFFNCDPLKTINVASENEKYKSVDGVLYTADGSELIKYTTGKFERFYEVLEGTRMIHSGAFMRTSLDYIVFPESLNELYEDFGSGAVEVALFKGDVPDSWWSSFTPDRTKIWYVEGKEGWTSPTWTSPSNYSYQTQTWDGVNVPKTFSCNHKVNQISLKNATCVSVGEAGSNGQNYSFYCKECDVHFADGNKTSVLEFVETPINPNNHVGPYVFGDYDVTCTACKSFANGLGSVTSSAAYASTAPVIDGKIDEIWNTTVSQNIVKNSLNVEGEANGYTKILWDKDAIYYLAVITDSTPIDADAASIANCVNFWISEKNTNAEFYADAGDYLYTIASNGTTRLDINDIWIGSPKLYEMSTKAVVSTSDGYIVELKIPSISGIEYTANHVIGYTFAIDDDFNNDGRGDEYSYSVRGTEAGGWYDVYWSTPKALGAVKFIECGHDVVRMDYEAANCLSAGQVASNGRYYSYYCSECDIHFANSDKTSVVEIIEEAHDPNNHKRPYVYEDGVFCSSCKSAIKLPEVANLGTVPHAAAPELDGVKDDVYYDGVIIPVNNPIRGMDRGLEAEASVLFSDDYLYVFVEVNDPNIVLPDSEHSKNPWDYDNVELFIDYSGKSVSDIVGVDRDYLSAAVQYRVDVSGFQSAYFRDESGDSDSAYGDGVQSSSSSDSEGRYAVDFFEAETTVDVKGGVYTIEYKIPLTNTMLAWGKDTIESGDTFGINFQITDFVPDSFETAGYTVEEFNGDWVWDAHLWPKLTLGENPNGAPAEPEVKDPYVSNKQVDIAKTKDSIVIDGVKDNAYNDSNMIEVKEQNLDSWDESPADTEAKVWTLWDDEYLYVFGELKDSDIYTEHEGNSSSIWSGDKLDIFVDFDYNRTPEYRYSYDDNGDNVAFISIAPDGGSNFFTGYHLLQEDLPYYDLVQTSAVIDADAGLVYYEARIPLPEDHVAVEDGMKIGFEVAFTNATNEAEERVGCVSWSEHGGLIWKWTSPAGTAALSDSYNHSIIEHAAKDATVEAEGNKLYYECEHCGKLFEDADAKVETTLEKVTIPKITYIPVSGISLSASDLRIVSGTSAKIVATLSPASATNKNVVWTSGNKDVATIKDGVVTATGLGNTVITVTTEDGEFSASCKVYVVCDHDLEAKTGAVATCSTVGIITSAGSRDYYYCSECDVCYSNEDKDQIVTLVEEAIDSDSHNIKENAAKESTYVSAGNELYYECTLCGKLYEDADCEVETDRASVIVPQMIQVSETGAVEIAVEEIEEVVVKDKATNTVTIPLDNTVDHETGEVVAVATVTLPVEVVSEATENNASLELKTSDSSIKLDTQALATVAEAVNASPESTVELKVQVGTADDSLEEEQVEAVEAHNVDEVAAVISASIVVDGKSVGSESEGGFNGGSATISVPFVPTEGSGSDYSILYVPDEGEAVIIDAKYDNATKCLVFTTEHLSEYAIVKLHKCNFTELKLNAAFHWYECSCGEQSTYVAHDYVSKNDVKDHWAECSGCGDIIDKAAHVSSGTATETKAETCTECGYIIENALGHSCEKHLTKVPAVKATCETDGNTEYYKCECGRLYKEADAITEFFNEADTVVAAKGHLDSDKDNHCDTCDKVLHVCVYKIFNDNYSHWLECSCGDVKDVAAHIESGWIIDVAPQAFESGSRHTECRYCGMIMKAETVDRLGWYDENMFIQSCIIDKKVYTLTSSSSSGGTLSYYGDMVVRNGSVVDYTITPAAGYRIDAVYINGVNIGVVDHYTFNYIKSSATIHVDFEKIQ